MNSRGFTLLEVLVSLTLLGIAGAAIVPALHSYSRFNRSMEIKSGALQAAQVILDEMRFQNPSTMRASGEDAAVTVDIGRERYAVSVAYCLRNQYCSSSSRHLKILVRHSEKVVYDVETVYTQLK